MELLDKVAIDFVKAESTAGFEHAVCDSGHVRVVVRHQMESENVLSRVKIDIVVSEDQVVAIVQLLAACDVNLAKVEAGRDKLTQALSSDISTTYINIFQVLELLGQACDALVLQIAATKETNLAEQSAL